MIFRQHLEKNSLAFVEETNSDADVSLDEILPSVYDNVIDHIQKIPRVIHTCIDQENGQEKFKFECSINCNEMYLNYLKTAKKYKKRVNERQYKKMYNRYVRKMFITK